MLCNISNFQVDTSHLATTAIHTTFCDSYLGLLGLGSFRRDLKSVRRGQDSEEELVSPYQGNLSEVFKNQFRTFLLLFQSIINNLDTDSY